MAISSFTQAIEVRSDYAFAYFGRGNVYLAKYEYEKPIEDYTTAAEHDPSYAPPFHNRAIAYVSGFDDQDAAIRDYTTAIELDPQYDSAYLGRALAYIALELDEQAILDLEMVLANAPKTDSGTRIRAEEVLETLRVRP